MPRVTYPGISHHVIQRGNNRCSESKEEPGALNYRNLDDRTRPFMVADIESDIASAQL